MSPISLDSPALLLNVYVVYIAQQLSAAQTPGPTGRWLQAVSPTCYWPLQGCSASQLSGGSQPRWWDGWQNFIGVQTKEKKEVENLWMMNDELGPRDSWHPSLGVFISVISEVPNIDDEWVELSLRELASQDLCLKIFRAENRPWQHLPWHQCGWLRCLSAAWHPCWWGFSHLPSPKKIGQVEFIHEIGLENVWNNCRTGK